jgi:hypothetical protein
MTPVREDASRFPEGRFPPWLVLNSSQSEMQGFSEVRASTGRVTLDRKPLDSKLLVASHLPESGNAQPVLCQREPA